MTSEQKLAMLKSLMEISGTGSDALLTAYLTCSEQEILQYKYSYASDVPTSVDAEDEMTQIMAVVAGYNLRGVENQNVSIENGTHRHFEYADMVAYIRGHVIAIAKVGG